MPFVASLSIVNDDNGILPDVSRHWGPSTHDPTNLARAKTRNADQTKPKK